MRTRRTSDPQVLRRSTWVLPAAVVQAPAARPVGAGPAEAVAASHARLGLDLEPARQGTRRPAGLTIATVRGPSLVAGVEDGDRLLAVNGTPVRSGPEFDAALERARSPGRTAVALLLVRDESRSTSPSS